LAKHDLLAIADAELGLRPFDRLLGQRLMAVSAIVCRKVC